MKVTRGSRLRIRVQNWLFVILFLAVIGMAGWLSTRFAFEADWTAGQRSTLSEASRHLVAGIDEPVRLTAFVRGGDMQRRPVADLVARYRRYSDLVQLEFVNPDVEPARAREAGIDADGVILVEHAGRQERVTEPSERSLSAALQRVTRGGERWAVFIEGHGERAPHGEANHDYGVFAGELQRQGVRVRTVNPLTQRGVPDNVSVLVVAGAQATLTPGTVDALVAYVERGGNLLWLQDPGPLRGLEPLAEHLGISFADGVILDPTAQMFGVDDPRMVIVAEYGAHPVTRDFSIITLFPHATAVDHELVPDDWLARPLLTTLAHSRLDTGGLGMDRDGPLDVGVSLSRAHDDAEQRVVVIGDGDFLSNAFLGNAGNLELGLNLVNWLVDDDAQLNVHVRSAPDLVLTLPRGTLIGISFGFLIVLPLLLVGAGVGIWAVRRRR